MDIVEFVKSFPVKNFTRGEILLDASARTSTILIIREGAIKATMLSETGTERLLWVAGRYDIIPTEGLLRASAVPRYFYTAFSDGSCFVVDKQAFLEAARSDVDIMNQIAQGLSEHHDDLLRRLESIEQPNLRRKILYTLQMLCEKFSSSDIVALHEISLNLTHQDVADMVHATREAVSLELKILQDEGYISYSRTSFVVYSAKIVKDIIEPA